MLPASLSVIDHESILNYATNCNSKRGLAFFDSDYVEIDSVVEEPLITVVSGRVRASMKQDKYLVRLSFNKLHIPKSDGESLSEVIAEASCECVNG